ncbi:MAG: amidohydrolase [Melioribacteraceae bacterium]|nr:amidohydrolase [Melioribacteraceae bacterium]MCF8354723.1 amidohydrolase [Melioribacteraceae bacterium]MCF8394352.1 amidohydrolase [Melioribacteraceae bacterium]MCF8420062.1 amidohydrolase [Melioribacteraceae bacterium]
MKVKTMFERILPELIKLRKTLHANAEIAGNEINTAQIIKSYVEKFKPDQVVENLGGNGIAFVYNGAEEGSSLLFRCELDALPIKETNQFDYKSKNENSSHKCGHDGHMSIISGLASILSVKKLPRGRVILLYQPSEETGEGAEKVLNDEKFNKIIPDFVYALHNLPGYSRGSVVIRKDIFASASKGIIIKLFGKTSHAAEPEHGQSPAPAMAQLINELQKLPDNEKINDFSLVTVIHTRLGERAFGTTPGYAEVMATLRSYTDEDMNELTSLAESLVRKICAEENLRFSIEYTEEFPSTSSDNESVEMIKRCAEENQLNIINQEKPFRWSEDFGHFTQKFNGGIFGLGSGEEHPQLHNPDYDFPDEIIPNGLAVFSSIIEKKLYGQ